MEYTIQLSIIDPDTGTESIETLAILSKNSEKIEDLGISLSESKTILESLQQKIVSQQIEECILAHRQCPHCGKKRRHKGSYPIIFRTLFGDILLKSPRFYHCQCHSQKAVTFSPLSEVLTEKIAPERVFLETKWGSSISYAQTVDLLKDVFPIDKKLNISSVRNHLHKVAKRHEDDVKKNYKNHCKEEKRRGDKFKRPKGDVVVGIDGGYIRNWHEKGKHFEVIAGKSFSQEQPSKFFSFVNSSMHNWHDQAFVARKIMFETLERQGVEANQHLDFFSDGAANLRELQELLYPNSSHYLDWFHITMRITVLKQYLKGMLKVDKKGTEIMQKIIDKLKWHLWHGNLIRADFYLSSLEYELELLENSYEHLKSFKKHAEDFITYVTNNQHLITDYSERYHHQETFTSSFVESTINVVVAKRFCKKQQMQWSSQGAHFVLLTRAKVLNGDLEDCFRKWFPNFRKTEINNQKEDTNAA